VASIPLAFVTPLLAVVLYGLVALIWLVPDRRIERRLGQATASHQSAPQSNES
jgi:hypothetical protein